MANASAIPATIDALVALFRAAGIETNDGPSVSDEPAPSVVLVGESPDPLNDSPVATGEQGWAWLGHNQRDETFEVSCVALAWNGDSDMRVARDAVFASMSAVAAAIQSDPRLGGAVLEVRGISSTSLYQRQSDMGAEASLPFTVSCRARLS